jgi:hypothetical protein
VTGWGRTIATLAVLAGGVGAAHPIDLIVQTAYVTLTPTDVHLRLEITPGVDVVALLLGPMDANGDGAMTDAESRLFAKIAVDQSVLLIDGVAADWTVTSVDLSSYDLLATGNGVISILASAPRPETPGNGLLIYQNLLLPAFSQTTANIFLATTDQVAFQVTAQARSDDGSLLIVAYAVSGP